MKKKFFFGIFSAFLIMFFINENSTLAAFENTLIVEEDFVKKDPVTGKYSSDWSHLNTEENMQLQKEIQEYYNSLQEDYNSLQTMSTKFKNGVSSEFPQVEFTELATKVNNLLENINPEIAIDSETSNKEQEVITPFNLSEDLYSKADSATTKTLEANIHVLRGLNPADMAVALQNSNGARDHASRYAKSNNWYAPDGQVKTWDNASDTLRHFAWNFMNANDLGIGKARLAGDIHEVTLLAVNYFKYNDTNAKNCNYNIFCMHTLAASSAIGDWDASKNSLATFNRIFNNPSTIMDLINNSKGRVAFNQGYSNYSEPFNIWLNNGTLIQFPITINSTHRTTAWNGFR